MKRRDIYLGDDVVVVVVVVVVGVIAFAESARAL